MTPVAHQRLSTDPRSVRGMLLYIPWTGGGARGQAVLWATNGWPCVVFALAVMCGQATVAMRRFLWPVLSLAVAALPSLLTSDLAAALKPSKAKEVQERNQKMGGGSLVQDRLGGAIYGS